MLLCELFAAPSYIRCAHEFRVVSYRFSLHQTQQSKQLHSTLINSLPLINFNLIFSSLLNKPNQHWWNGILLEERMEWNSMAEMGLRPITNKSIKLTYLLSSLLSAHPAVKKRKKRRKRETAKRREVKEKKSINYLLFHQIKFNNSMKLIVVWLICWRREGSPWGPQPTIFNSLLQFSGNQSNVFDWVALLNEERMKSWLNGPGRPPNQK